MLKMKIFVVAGALLAAAAVAPASAHHSFPATYHVDQMTEINGTVVQFLFRNPHSFVHVMAPDKAGQMQRWAVEWGGGAALTKDKVDSTTLRAGDKVIISGNPARVDSDHRLRMQKIVRPADGWTWGGNFD